MPVARRSVRSGPIYGKFDGVVTIPYNDSCTPVGHPANGLALLTCDGVLGN